MVGEADGTALTITLRCAVAADTRLLRIWDRKPHVDAASGEDGDFDWEAEVPRDVGWRDILIAEQDGRPIGVVVIIDPAEEETHYWGEIEPDLRAIDIWIGEEADLGKGYGTQMMRLAIAHCFAAQQVKAILIDPLVSNAAAHRFYERSNFRRSSAAFFPPWTTVSFIG